MLERRERRSEARRLGVIRGSLVLSVSIPQFTILKMILRSLYCLNAQAGSIGARFCLSVTS